MNNIHPENGIPVSGIIGNGRMKILNCSMTLIINPRNKQQEKVVRAFLSSLDIGFYSEAEEDAALVNAMRKGRKTVLLNKTEKADFIRRLKRAK